MNGYFSIVSFFRIKPPLYKCYVLFSAHWLFVVSKFHFLLSLTSSLYKAYIFTLSRRVCHNPLSVGGGKYVPQRKLTLSATFMQDKVEKKYQGTWADLHKVQDQPLSPPKSWRKKVPLFFSNFTFRQRFCHCLTKYGLVSNFKTKLLDQSSKITKIKIQSLDVLQVYFSQSADLLESLHLLTATLLLR